MAKRKTKYDLETEGHFYATSIAEWRVHEDVEILIGQMKAAGYNFTLIWVPLSVDASYQIEYYVPAVEGCVKLAEYKQKS